MCWGDGPQNVARKLEREEKNGMNIQIKIEETEQSIKLYAPYSLSNNKDYKSRGGKWDKDSSVWEFPKTEATQKMFAELFGAPSEIVTAKVEYKDIEVFENFWQIGGYVIASRRGRDYPAQVATGVQTTAGTFKRICGSVKNPAVGYSEDGLVFDLVCYRSFAEFKKLEIKSVDSTFNPLAAFTDDQILAEIKRRGL